MSKYFNLAWLGLAMIASGAVAQTNVTNNNDGAANTVPVYTSNAVLGNSPISVNAGNVGIGTTAPNELLEVASRVAVSDGGGANRGALLLINPGYGGAGQHPYGEIGVYSYAGAGASMNLVLAGPMTGGNVGIGTTSPGATLEVNGNVKLTANSGASITFPDDTVQSTAWTGALGGGDYAESVNISEERTKYQPGDLLVVDKHDPSKFVKSTEPYSTLVAGIYSTRPGAVGRRQTRPKGPDEVPMAVVGIVPAKVSAENGAIEAGDLLVSSSTSGIAMKGTDRNRMLGAVVGKAMGTLGSGIGTIEVLVSLQ